MGHLGKFEVFSCPDLRGIKGVFVHDPFCQSGADPLLGSIRIERLNLESGVLKVTRSVTAECYSSGSSLPE